MKKFLEQSFLFTKNSVFFILYLLRLIRKNYYRNPINKIHSGTVAILANGPSLKNELHNFTTLVDPHFSDYIVLNNFALDDAFYLLKSIIV